VQALSQSMATKVNRSEVAKLLKQAAAAALAAANAAMTAAPPAPGRALKGTCLACDRELETRRPEPLGPLPSAAGLLPESEQFARPATAHPIGPGINAAAHRQAQLDDLRAPGEVSGAAGSAAGLGGGRMSTGGALDRMRVQSARTPVFA
jgi:hypothetical protein